MLHKLRRKYFSCISPCISLFSPIFLVVTVAAPCIMDSFSAHELCEASVDYVLRRVNTIQYLIRSIEDISGELFSRERIKCTSSSPRLDHTPKASVVSAGYMWRSVPQHRYEKGDIVLLEDHLAPYLNRKPSNVELSDGELEKHYPKALHYVERNVRHELVHAFDDTRGEIDSTNCLHHACSEIRAARLSGDCLVSEEIRKGRFNLATSGRECVRRRATMALETNPICRGFSERAVDKAFPQCYWDYEPFASPVYAMGSYGEAIFPNGTLKPSS